MSYSGDTDPLLVAIHAAIVNNDPMQLARICQEDVDLDERFSPEINEQHVGMTPLALACALNKVQLAEVLLNSGADVNSRFASLNTTALMTSSFHGHVDIVRLLLERGADVGVLDAQQSTALGYAFGGTRNHEVISMLLKSGIDVNQKNMLGMNALLLVAGYGNDALVHMVLQAGADPNAVNDFGHTAFHLAVVGKKDQLKKFRTGAPESNSLNRRNLDQALAEWARLHKDNVPNGGVDRDEAYNKVGQYMMSIGQKLEAGDLPDEDEQEVMKRRVEAVWRYRQDRLAEWRSKNKGGGLGGLLSCGGGKSKKVSKTSAPTNRPYVPEGGGGEVGGEQGGEAGAISERCSRVMSLLLRAGCSVDRTEHAFGMTPLDMALLNGDVESSAQLVGAGADPDHLMKMFALSDMYAAIAHRNKRQIKELLAHDHDLDLNMPFSRFSVTPKSERGVELPGLDETGDEGLLPIAMAVRTDDMEIVRMLLRAAAAVDGMGPAGRAAIHEAAGKGLTKMCAFLMTNGANSELVATGFLDCTPVAIAAIMKHRNTVELFITRDAKVDAELSDGTNALLKAAAQNDMEMLHTLLSANLERNFIHGQGFYALMAAKYQSPERDAEAILQEVQERIRQLEAEKREKERQKQLAEENRHRILPRPEPVRGPPAQPARPAPVIANQQQPPRGQPVTEAPPRHLQQAPPPRQQAPPQRHHEEDEEDEEEESEEEEEEEEEEETEEEEEEAPVAAPVVAAPVVAQKPPVAHKPAVAPKLAAHPAVQPPQPAQNGAEESEDEEESEEEEEESEESEEEEEQAPPAVRRPAPTAAQAPPPLPSGPPPPTPAGPPPASDEESEEETESEEEEEDSEEEEEESEEEEEAKPQVVQRTVTTQRNAQGQQVTHTKTVVMSKPVPAARHAQEEDEETEEETDSEEEEDDEEEETEEEESEEEEVVNNNNRRMKQLNISHDNKETTI